MSLEKHAKQIIKDDRLTTVIIITIDENNQTAMTATVRDQTPEATDLLNQVGRLVSGRRPLDSMNKLPI